MKRRLFHKKRLLFMEKLFQMTMAFLGQTSLQVPQPTQRSSSCVQDLAARPTVRAPAGQLRAQIVQ